MEERRTAPDEISRAALATYLTKKPALLAFSRKESTIFHPKRHPIRFEREMGVTRDGKVTAVRAKVVLDGGAYASLSSRDTVPISLPGRRRLRCTQRVR